MPDAYRKDAKLVKNFALMDSDVLLELWRGKKISVNFKKINKSILRLLVQESETRRAFNS